MHMDSVSISPGLWAIYLDIRKPSADLLTVYVLGYRRPGKHIVSNPNGWPSYYLMYVYEEIEAVMKGKMVKMVPNSFAIWEPGAPLIYGKANSQWSHSWIRISGKVMSALVSEAQIPLEQPIVCATPDLFERYLGEVYLEMQHQVPNSLILRNSISTLLLQMNRQLSLSSADCLNLNLAKCVRYLQEHYAEEINLEDLAEQACLSKAHFCVRFKEYTGVTPMDYLRQVRMHHAWSLLADANLTVKEVALACGYKDALYFTRLFSRYFGENPTGYRRRILSAAPTLDRVVRDLGEQG